MFRVRYGAHEKDAEHDRSAGVVVFLTDTHSRVTEGGKPRDANSKAGTARWVEAGKVQVEKLADQPQQLPGRQGCR